MEERETKKKALADSSKKCASYFNQLEQRGDGPSSRCVFLVRRLNDDIAYLEILIRELERRIEAIDG